jgi:hypothetical protein
MKIVVVKGEHVVINVVTAQMKSVVQVIQVVRVATAVNKKNIDVNFTSIFFLN